MNNDYVLAVSRKAEATFLFADIAGFTALTEAHGDEHAVQLVEEFANVVQAELPRVDGEYVKAVGDALMLRVPDPADAVRLGLWITRNAMSGHRCAIGPRRRNHGSAVERSGDYFGTTINVAARVSALAAGGEVLVTGQTAALAPDLEGVRYESRGRQVLRNVAEPVEIFAVVRVDEVPIAWRSTPSAGWRSIQSVRSVVCCSTRRCTTSVRLLVRQLLPSTRSVRGIAATTRRGIHR